MRTMLLGDIGNRLDIQDAENNISALQSHAASAAKAVGNQTATIARLKNELARQKLAVTALTRFLIAKGLVSEAELQEFIHDVDSEDGIVDGKMEIETVNGRQRLVRPHIPPGTFRRIP
ncbi:hypothetical protein KBB96_07930 [Luteolibacter ambystomatis]|uniref:Uncharacterized protein n=1 Tax=Luteolibacter ambystomatis TaxID=2824561 RepID=A0A975PH10_9BACT|nr:hypothetical protein [Luteolibacter ambystomatis]QUE52811.1 hypothetical protein KBB96_07930 [Luteolibacter ambystomatis]